MKALVTGGAGFIGSHVVRSLLARGIAVRVLHLPGEKLANLNGLDVELIAGDVRDPALANRAMQGVDWLFHMAAIYALWLPKPELMRDVNVGGTRNMLRAAGEAGVKRVVYTSSIAVFGGHGLTRDATEESAFALRPTGDLYSLTKYESHEVAREFAASGLDVTIVAPTGPIGPGDIAPTPTGRLLLTAVTLPVAAVVDTVNNIGDVRDIALGHVLAAEKGRNGHSYLLGNRNVAMSEMVGIVRRLTGARKPVLKFTPGILKLGAQLMTAYSERVSRRAPLMTPAAIEIAKRGLRADCSKAVRELGLPQTPTETSIRDALQWFAANGYVKNPKSLLRRLERFDSRAGTATLA